MLIFLITKEVVAIKEQNKMGIIVKLTDLIEVQRTVNSIIKEKLEKPVTNKEFILAFNVELFEYFNAIGI